MRTFGEQREYLNWQFALTIDSESLLNQHHSHSSLSQGPPEAEPDLATCSFSPIPVILPSFPHSHSPTPPTSSACLSLTTHSILPGYFYFTYVWLSLLPEWVPQLSLPTFLTSKKYSSEVLLQSTYKSPVTFVLLALVHSSVHLLLSSSRFSAHFIFLHNWIRFHYVCTMPDYSFISRKQPQSKGRG